MKLPLADAIRRFQMPNREMRPHWAVAVAAFLLGVGLLAFRLSPRRSAEVGASWAFVDFRAAIYYPARAFLEGLNPYDASVYLTHFPDASAVHFIFPPIALLVFIPFALSSAKVGSLLFVVFSLGLVILLVVLSLRMTNIRVSAPAVLLVSGIVILSRTGQQHLLLGQVSLLPILGVYLCLWFASKSPLVAGLALTLALIKPQFGLPAAALLLAGRAYGSLLVGGCVALIANAVPLVLAVRHSGGVASFLQGIRSLPGSFVTENKEILDFALVRLDIPTLVDELTALGFFPALMLALLVLAPALWIVRRDGLEWSGRDGALRLTVVMSTLLLAVYHPTYDALLLLWPSLALWAAFRAGNRGALLELSIIALLGGVAFNYLASQSVVALLDPSRPLWIGIALLNRLALLAAAALALRGLHASLEGPPVGRSDCGTVHRWSADA